MATRGEAPRFAYRAGWGIGGRLSLFAALFSSLPLPSFAVTPGGVVLAWNAAAESVYGYAAEEAVGRAPPIFSGASRDAFAEALRRALAGAGPMTVDVECATRHDAPRVSRLRAAPLAGGEGAVFLDVGEVAQAELRAETERWQFQAVLDAIPAPIWFKDEEGIYRGCNAEFQRYLGIPRERIVGGTVFDVAPSDLAEVYRKADLELIRSGGTQVYESQVQWADGTRREVVFRKAAIVGPNGNPAGLAGAILDVTDQRIAERRLRARLAQQSALTSLAARALDEEDPGRLLETGVRLAVAAHGADGGGVVRLEEEGGCVTVRRVVGVGPQPGPDSMPLEDDPISRRAVRTGRPFLLEEAELPESLREAGLRSLAAVLVGSRETPLGALAIFGRAPRQFSGDDAHSLEATAHILAIALGRGRALEAARAAKERLARSERLASIGTLAAGVAHELNNPLTFVLSNLGFAQEELPRLRARSPEPETWSETLRALDEAAEGAERMRNIARDLRTMARPDDAGVGPVEVRRIVEYAANLAGAEVRRRARLTWDLAAVAPVVGNEARLGQVFLNLLVNAAHAIPEGAPDRHEIRVSARPEPGARVSISVSDDGSGIPPDIRERIFDPFFTTKPVGLGTGLGLWMCHNIVTAHGGTIDVETASGRGTTFRVTLPAASESVPLPPEESEDGPSRPRVLVVDDEPLVIAAARRHLSGSFAVDAASCAAEALDRILASRRYHAIVCDVSMPGGGGLELLETLRGLAPDVVGRFLFVTGGVTGNVAARLAASGRPVLEKPFDGGQLRAAVRSVLG